MAEIVTKAVIDITDFKRGIDEMADAGKKLDSSINTSLSKITNSFQSLGDEVSQETIELNKHYAALEKAGNRYDELSSEILKSENYLRTLIVSQKQGNAVTNEQIKAQALVIKSLRDEKSSIDKLAVSYQNATNKVSQYNNFTNKLRAGFEDFSNSMMAQLGGVALAEQAVMFAREGVNAYMEQAEAQNRLLGALNGNVKAQKQLLEDAERIKNAYVIDDDAINSAQAFLASTGKTVPQIRKVIETAAIFSRATGKDFATSVEMLGSTLEGSKGKLGKYANELKNMDEKSLMAGGALDYFATSMRGAADSYKESDIGRLQSFNIVLDDTKKALGGLILAIPGLKSTGENIKGFLNTLNSLADIFSFDAQKIGNAIGTLSTHFLTLNTSFIRMVTGIDVSKWLRGLVDPLTNLSTSVFGADSAITSFVKGLSGLNESEIPTQTADNNMKMAMSFNVLKKAIEDASNAEQVRFQNLQKWGKLTADATGKLKDLLLTNELLLQQNEKLTPWQKQIYEENLKKISQYKSEIRWRQSLIDKVNGEVSALGKHTVALKENNVERGKITFPTQDISTPYSELTAEISKAKSELNDFITLSVQTGDKSYDAAIEATLMNLEDLETQLKIVDNTIKDLQQPKPLGMSVGIADGIDITNNWIGKLFNLDEKLDGTKWKFIEAFIAWGEKENVSKMQKGLSESLKLWDQFYSKLLDLRLAQNQKLLDENQKQIDALKENQRKEEDLAKSGYANNLKANKDAMAKLTAERKVALAEQEKIQRKERTLTQLQAGVDMAGAVAKTIKNSQGAGPAGAILAAINVAAILALFAVSISKSKVAATKLGKGGMLNGRSHSDGGIFIPELNTEVEGKEYVINKKSTKKWLPLIEMINKDDKRLANFNLNDKRNVNVNVNFEDSKNLAETNRILRNGQREKMWKEGNDLFYKNGIVTTRITK